jgi:hypothetical protein
MIIRVGISASSDLAVVVLDRTTSLGGAHQLDAFEVVQRPHVIAHVRKSLVDRLRDLVRACHLLVEDGQDAGSHGMRERFGEARIDEDGGLLGHLGSSPLAIT